MKINDQLDRTLYFDETPYRIISLAPCLTELIVDLGLADMLVGVTRFCNQNQFNKKITVIGKPNKLYKNAGFIRADIVLSDTDENTTEMIEKLAIESMIYISNVKTIEDNLKLISDLGAIFSIQKTADKLIKKINNKLTNFKNFLEKKPSKRVIYFQQKKSWEIWIATGKGIYINEMLLLNKFENMLAIHQYPYFEVDLHSFVGFTHNLIPEIILLPSHPFQFEKEHKKELKKYIDCQYVFVDGKMFNCYGTRILKAIDYFKKLHLKLK